MAIKDQLLYSTIVNTSGSKLLLNFIGFTGVTLEPNETHTQFGTLFDWVRDGSFGLWTTPRRKMLEDVIADGKIAVLQTPSVVLGDLATYAIDAWGNNVPSKSFMAQANTDKLELVQVQTGAPTTVVVVGP
ncbi:MAG: hypothetical protein KatS3mg109_0055 [Pirellulaceae bacterium]|nr:MAG: hypothetical protein KatS3mg109_0055 [Pirellulaceae bacterium]